MALKIGHSPVQETLEYVTNVTNKLGFTGFTKAADTVSDLRITHRLTWNL